MILVWHHYWIQHFTIWLIDVRMLKKRQNIFWKIWVTPCKKPVQCLNWEMLNVSKVSNCYTITRLKFYLNKMFYFEFNLVLIRVHFRTPLNSVQNGLSNNFHFQVILLKHFKNSKLPELNSLDTTLKADFISEHLLLNNSSNNKQNQLSEFSNWFVRLFTHLPFSGRP